MLAKLVNGRKAVICAVVRAVMLCLFNRSVSRDAGAAWTNVRAQTITAKMEPFENIFSSFTPKGQFGELRRRQFRREGEASLFYLDS